jgi:hypothetical protein
MAEAFGRVIDFLFRLVLHPMIDANVSLKLPIYIAMEFRFLLCCSLPVVRRRKTAYTINHG